MKKIQKERQHIEYVDVYQATDGTEFLDEQECLKYEKSALGLMRARIEKLIVYDSSNTNDDAWTLLGGSDDHDIKCVKMNNKNDFDTVCQFFLLECSWYNGDSMKEARNKKLALIEETFKAKDILIFGVNCDGDFYIINSRQNIINNLLNLDKK